MISLIIYENYKALYYLKYIKSRNKIEMITQQINDQITKQLSHNLPNQNFTFLGSSNGLVIESLFPYKVMAYISVHADNDHFMYDLCIATLENVNINKTSTSREKMVRKIPLVFSGELAKLMAESAVNVDRIQVQMKPSPRQQLILLIKIGVLYKGSTQSKDSLSLLVLDPEQLKPDKKYLNLLRIKSGDSRIYDFIWHPLSNFTILTLLSNETIQMWDLSEQDFMKPTKIIKAKHFKNNQQVSKNVKFTSFAILNTYDESNKTDDGKKLNINKFALFLLNSIGVIVSVFPFLPVGSMISRQDYDMIYDEQYDSNQMNILRKYLNNCQFDEKQDSCTLTYTPLIENHCQIQKWSKSTSKNYRLVDINKLLKQVYYYSIKLFSISSQYTMVIQTFRTLYQSYNSIWISLIFKNLQILEQNTIYQVAQIRNQVKNANNDIRLINSDIKASRQILKQSQCLYYTQRNNLYHLDLTNLFKFMDFNQLRFLQMEVSFPVVLVFSLSDNQSIEAIAIEQSLACINFIRRSPNKVKFQILLRRNLSAFSQIQNISRQSKQLLKKLQSLKVEFKNLPLSPQKQKSTELKIGPDKINEYKTKGIERIKDDYKGYCDAVNSSIDDSMSKLKVNYELMRKKFKQFNQFKNHKKQLSKLMKDVEQNNNIISQMLFDMDNQEKPVQGELGQLEKNINTINDLLRTVEKKELNIKQSQNNIMEEISSLFYRLRQVRQKLDQAKKIKKDLQNQDTKQ